MHLMQGDMALRPDPGIQLAGLIEAIDVDHMKSKGAGA